MSLYKLRTDWSIAAIKALADAPTYLIRNHGADIRFSHVGVDSDHTPSGRRFIHAQTYAVFMTGDGALVPLTPNDLMRVVGALRELPLTYPNRNSIIDNMKQELGTAVANIRTWNPMLDAIRPGAIGARSREVAVLAAPALNQSVA